MTRFLAQLADDLRYHYRVMNIGTLPLGLGQCRQRINRVTMRTTYWFRFADHLVWQRLRPGGVDALPTCRNAADIRELLDSAPLPAGTRVQRAESRPGVPGVAPAPATGPARQASPPVLAGRVRALRGAR